MCEELRTKEALSRMQLAHNVSCRTHHHALRLVQATFAWSVKTRHAPSRHCRDVRVYGHTNTAMHDMRPPPPPYSLAYHRTVACHYRIHDCPEHKQRSRAHSINGQDISPLGPAVLNLLNSCFVSGSDRPKSEALTALTKQGYVAPRVALLLFSAPKPLRSQRSTRRRYSTAAYRGV